ncbi:MAG: DUF4313 domain-containing protein [Eubacterium sp.]|nr:DUF4313 domain-containing protein [Eubacterium sp.]
MTLTKTEEINEVKGEYGMASKEIDDISIEIVISSYYYNKQLSLSMAATRFDGLELRNNITVNLGAYCPPFCSYVDVNNFPPAEKFIADNELGCFTGVTKKEGGSEYPLYQFFPDKLKEIDSEEVQKYIEENQFTKEQVELCPNKKGYSWPGMKKLNMEEIEKYTKEDGLMGAYILYPDNTESEIDSPLSLEEVKDMIGRGLEFGYEKPEPRQKQIQKKSLPKH